MLFLNNELVSPIPMEVNAGDLCVGAANESAMELAPFGPTVEFLRYLDMNSTSTYTSTSISFCPPRSIAPMQPTLPIGPEDVYWAKRNSASYGTWRQNKPTFTSLDPELLMLEVHPDNSHRDLSVAPLSEASEELSIDWVCGFNFPNQTTEYSKAYQPHLNEVQHQHRLIYFSPLCAEELYELYPRRFWRPSRHPARI